MKSMTSFTSIERQNIRILIDTNVLAAAYMMNDEHAKRVLSLCLQRNVVAVTTDEITDEWVRVMSKLLLEKIAPIFVLENGFVQALRIIVGVNKSIMHIVSRADHVRIGTCKLYCEDRSDDMYMQCAVEHDVSIIISADNHLGSVDGKHKTCTGRTIEVLSPMQFWFKLNKK